MLLQHISLRPVVSGLTLAAALAIATALPAAADDITGTVGITGGSLTMSATDAPAVTATLNGTDQTVNDSFDIDVKDFTGTGAGWKLQITSTAFSTGGDTPHTLSNDAASITAVNALCDGGTCSLPTNGVNYPLTVPADTTAPAAVTFFNAAEASGMGDFTVTPTFRVSIPANTFAGNYSSTITITSANGPS